MQTRNSKEEDIKEFNKDFVKKTLNELFALVLAANYLHISSLLELLYPSIVDRIKEKTPEAIGKIFNIPCDFSPDEERKIIEDNKWAHEGTDINGTLDYIYLFFFRSLIFNDGLGIMFSTPSQSRFHGSLSMKRCLIVSSPDVSQHKQSSVFLPLNLQMISLKGCTVTQYLALVNFAHRESCSLNHHYFFILRVSHMSFILIIRKMTSDSQMQDAAMPVGTTNIATSSCTNAPPTMAPAEKPKNFVGINFKRWQQKMFFYLTTLCLQRFTSEDPPEVTEGTSDKERFIIVEAWKYSDFLCRNYILSGHVNYKTLRRLINLEVLSNFECNKSKCQTSVESNRDISDINVTKRILESKFDMKDLRVVDVILGIRIHQTPQGLALSQSHYIEKVLDKFKYMEFGIAKTPLDASFVLQKNEGESDSQLEYARVLGCLMYIINCTCTISKLGRYTSNPNKTHWMAMKRVLGYLKYTQDYALHYNKYPGVLEGYSDANWITGSNKVKSTSGYVFTIGRGAVSWKSFKQTCIAHSTMESEFIALNKPSEEAE
ncbi:hypothetical protein BC332_29866 [Capsicum chinense]|nr:hypothetical protein BC332_29866 [Capsicum chinense]